MVESFNTNEGFNEFGLEIGDDIAPYVDLGNVIRKLNEGEFGNTISTTQNTITTVEKKKNLVHVETIYNPVDDTILYKCTFLEGGNILGIKKQIGLLDPIILCDDKGNIQPEKSKYEKGDIVYFKVPKKEDSFEDLSNKRDFPV